ncbi:hypothetical protein ACFE04_021499 [Oxalis oulophora]
MASELTWNLYSFGGVVTEKLMWTVLCRGTENTVEESERDSGRNYYCPHPAVSLKKLLSDAYRVKYVQYESKDFSDFLAHYSTYYVFYSASLPPALPQVVPRGNAWERSGGGRKMKLCFASIRLSATIKMGDKDDRPFSSTPQCGGCELRLSVDSFHGRKVKTIVKFDLSCGREPTKMKAAK